jgi:hypothetical protein
MKTPRFFNWDDVPRQMVSSAMDDVLPNCSGGTSVVPAAADDGGFNRCAS